MIQATTINGDWVVSRDGVVIEWFLRERYGSNACFLAARLANKLRQESTCS